MTLVKTIVALLMTGCVFACTGPGHGDPVAGTPAAPQPDFKTVEAKIKEVEQALGARVGVSLYDTGTRGSWSYNGDLRFPMMSTFKTLACAKALLDGEKNRVSFHDSVLIDAASLVTWSPITRNAVGQRFSLQQACDAMMIMSDNTAANIVLEKTGGPGALTAFMRSIGDHVTRLDRIEPKLGQALDGDARDTTTPNAMVKSLHRLLFGEVLSEASKTRLRQWMMGNKVAGSLFRSVLPEGWSIADRSGAGGYGSRGITAVVWSETLSPLVIGVYLTQTGASFDDRNKAVADIGQRIFSLYE